MGFLYLRRAADNRVVHRWLRPALQRLRRVAHVLVLSRRDVPIHLHPEALVKLHLAYGVHLCHLPANALLREERHPGQRGPRCAILQRQDVHCLRRVVLLDAQLLYRPAHLGRLNGAVPRQRVEQEQRLCVLQRQRKLRSRE